MYRATRHLCRSSPHPSSLLPTSVCTTPGPILSWISSALSPGRSIRASLRCKHCVLFNSFVPSSQFTSSPSMPHPNWASQSSSGQMVHAESGIVRSALAIKPHLVQHSCSSAFTSYSPPRLQLQLSLPPLRPFTVHHAHFRSSFPHPLRLRHLRLCSPRRTPWS